MAIYLKDEATSKAVRKLAKLRGVSLTDAVRTAVEHALEQERLESEDAAINALQQKLKAYPATGLQADKAFYDSLYED